MEVNEEIGALNPSPLVVKVSSMVSGQAGPNPSVVMSSPFFLPTPLNSAPFMPLVVLTGVTASYLPCWSVRNSLLLVMGMADTQLDTLTGQMRWTGLILFFLIN